MVEMFLRWVLILLSIDTTTITANEVRKAFLAMHSCANNVTINVSHTAATNAVLERNDTNLIFATSHGWGDRTDTRGPHIHGRTDPSLTARHANASATYGENFTENVLLELDSERRAVNILRANPAFHHASTLGVSHRSGNETVLALVVRCDGEAVKDRVATLLQKITPDFVYAIATERKNPYAYVAPARRARIVADRTLRLDRYAKDSGASISPFDLFDYIAKKNDIDHYINIVAQTTNDVENVPKPVKKKKKKKHGR